MKKSLLLAIIVALIAGVLLIEIVLQKVFALVKMSYVYPMAWYKIY